MVGEGGREQETLQVLQRCMKTLKLSKRFYSSFLNTYNRLRVGASATFLDSILTSRRLLAAAALCLAVGSKSSRSCLRKPFLH